MCGIIACISKDTIEILLEGLKQLQNRGYDSAGVATFSHETSALGSIEDGEIEHEISNKQDYSFNVNKFASNDKESAIEKLEENKSNHFNALLGIAHTRWATHGPKTDINSHPHISTYGHFCLVHNGIIENYKEIKEMLIENNFTFKSETDTEVIVNLLEYYFLKLKDVEGSIEKTIENLQGTGGLVILSKEEPNKLFCTRKGSPLLVSKQGNLVIIASEQSAFCNKTNNYIALENQDICILELDNDSDTISMKTKHRYRSLSVTNQNMQLTPYPYDHWTQKEIYEQVDSSLRAISLGGRLLSGNEVRLGGLIEQKEQLMQINHLILLGCGTSYFAGMLGKKYFQDLCDFHTIQLIDGSEFELIDIPKKGKTALILLSQSGETKDLHRCLEMCNDVDVMKIGVVNVVDSLIAREVDCGCYLNAGREVGVASTKSFTSQVILLSMMAVWFAQVKHLNENKRAKIIKDLRKLYLDIENTLENCDYSLPNIIELFKNKKSCFILGKDKGEAIAREAALKIKEISYIHAEGYSSSSLKHGPFALLEKGFPVILIAPDNKYYSKNMNAYEEIKSRYANVIVITDKENKNIEHKIVVSKNKSYADLLTIIPLQLLAYKLSIARDINVDMPRNLAKVVTVE